MEDIVQPLMELLKLLGTLGEYTLVVAVTAIVGMLLFKLTQLVSILLLIKYGVTRFFDWATTKKVSLIDNTIHFTFEKILIRDEKEENGKRFIALLKRLSNITYHSSYTYIHKHDLDRFEEALDYLEDKYSKPSITTV